MTRRGLKVALQHADSLPSFPSLDEAKRVLFQLRDDLRDRIQQLSNRCNVPLDFSPDSLKALEKWYFDLCRSDGFGQLGVTQEEFERCMGFYNGFVHTENDPRFKWIVKESPFMAGRFEIGVTKERFIRMVGRVSHLQQLKNNKRMQSMFREYKKYASPPKEPRRRAPIKGHKGNKPCPECRQPLRTNQAQQCFECGATWSNDESS